MADQRTASLGSAGLIPQPHQTVHNVIPGANLPMTPETAMISRPNSGHHKPLQISSDARAFTTPPPPPQSDANNFISYTADCLSAPSLQPLSRNFDSNRPITRSQRLIFQRPQNRLAPSSPYEIAARTLLIIEPHLVPVHRHHNHVPHVRIRGPERLTTHPTEPLTPPLNHTQPHHLPAVVGTHFRFPRLAAT